MQRHCAGLSPAAVAALLLLAPAPALAWGATGHRVVGRVAERHLTDEAAREVAAILGPESLAQAATWADDIRSDPLWRQAPPWHYISIDDAETLESTARAPEGDVVEAIERFTAVLADRGAPRERRAEALRFVVHFVGDVHQPLHVGRRADRGGNDVRLTWHGEPANLHSVWDSLMIDSDGLSFSELAEFIDHPTLLELEAWQAAPLAEWVRESKALRGRVYDIGDGRLGYQYSYRYLPLVKQRLLQAGVRLAGLLNRTFASPEPSIPLRD